MASVKWSGAALLNLESLDPIIRERVLMKVSWLADNFSTITPEPLHRERRGLYKLRVGDYRAVYAVRADSIIIEEVGHRRDIYR
ncbi:MAG TPA: type II toxin-antitoxin system RelE/ParE family toxin [Candidatus Paceibacterota bacterium]